MMETFSRYWNFLFHSNRGLLLVHGVLFLIAISPLLSVHIPMLTDYLNHLARNYIIYNLENSPELQEKYTVTWGVIPNSGMEHTMPILQMFFDVFTSGKIFMTATLFVLVAGTLTLNFVLWKRLCATTLFIYPFLFSNVFSWGFFNFLFATGFMLLGFAGWIYTEHWKKLKKYLLFSVFSVVLFFLHLFAFGFFIAMIGAYEWQMNRPIFRKNWWKAMMGIAIMLIPVGILSFFLPPDQRGALITSHGGINTILKTVSAPTLFNSNVFQIDVMMLTGFITWQIIRFFRVAHPLKYPLRIGFILAFITPFWFMGVAFVNIRIPVALTYLLIAGMNPSPPDFPKIGKALERGFLCVLIAITLTRSYITDRDIRLCAGYVDEYHRAAEQVFERGKSAVMLGEMVSTLPCGTYSSPWHVVVLGIITSHLYMPELSKGIPPLNVTEKYKDYAPAHTNPVPFDLLYYREYKNVPPYILNWRERYDYIIDYHFGLKRKRIPDDLKPLHIGSYFTIYENTAKFSASF